MEKTDLKKKIDKDLNKILSEKRTELREFRFSLSGSKIKNIKKGRSLRKEIARILTELTLRKGNSK
ncbi:MAG: 50S ribosomal protein L29 [Candidatus Pacebacteria bacterium]|nr:50S ribosomal protein L29 [Candidatus Paceibacterota bacterium]